MLFDGMHLFQRLLKEVRANHLFCIYLFMYTSTLVLCSWLCSIGDSHTPEAMACQNMETHPLGNALKKNQILGNLLSCKKSFMRKGKKCFLFYNILAYFSSLIQWCMPLWRVKKPQLGSSAECEDNNMIIKFVWDSFFKYAQEGNIIILL